jgi:hypothetical protein
LLTKSFTNNIATGMVRDRCNYAFNSPKIRFCLIKLPTTVTHKLIEVFYLTHLTRYRFFFSFFFRALPTAFFRLPPPPGPITLVLTNSAAYRHHANRVRGELGNKQEDAGERGGQGSTNAGDEG